MLAVDRNGTIVDGDELIALAPSTCARPAACRATRRVTVMTTTASTPRWPSTASRSRSPASATGYVLEALRERDWALGGEQSGHIIDRTSSPRATHRFALLTLEALNGPRPGRSPRDGKKLPQRLVNVRVRDREALQHATEVHAAVERESAALEGRGRVLCGRAEPSRSCV